MKRYHHLALGLIAAAGIAGAAVAAPITIKGPYPINDLPTGSPPPDCIGVGTGPDPTFIANSCTAMIGLTQFYKKEAGGPEEGSLLSSYSTVLNNDNSGAVITWDGPLAFQCGGGDACWLLVKDGNQQPGRYAYNLTNLWDGVSTITLTGFWPDNGEISHIGIWGERICRVNCTPNNVPEPISLALVGLGLLGVGLSRRRRS